MPYKSDRKVFKKVPSTFNYFLSIHQPSLIFCILSLYLAESQIYWLGDDLVMLYEAPYFRLVVRGSFQSPNNVIEQEIVSRRESRYR